MISRAIRSASRGSDGNDTASRPSLSRSRSQLNISAPTLIGSDQLQQRRSRSNSLAPAIYPALPSPQSPVPPLPPQFASRPPSPPLTPQQRQLTPTGSDAAEPEQDDSELTAPYDDPADEPPSPSNDPRDLPPVPQALYSPLSTRMARSRPVPARAPASVDSVATQGSHQASRTYPTRALVGAGRQATPQLGNMRVHVEPIAGQPNQFAVEMRYVITVPAADNLPVAYNQG